LILHVDGIVGIPLRLGQVRGGTVAVPEILALAGPGERHTTAIPALVGLATEEEGRVLELVFWDICDFGESELLTSERGVSDFLKLTSNIHRDRRKTQRRVRVDALVEISRPWER
jgi:hypothetical protein